MFNAFAMSSLLALTACGGGGRGGTASVPAASTEGLWNGDGSTFRSVTAIVLDNASYWLRHSVPHVSAVVAGFIQGSSSSLNGSFPSSGGVDFNLEGEGINNVTLAASHVVRQSFNGSVCYPARTRH